MNYRYSRCRASPDRDPSSLLEPKVDMPKCGSASASARDVDAVLLSSCHPFFFADFNAKQQGCGFHDC